MSSHKLPFTRRRNSWYIRSVPCPLVSKMKNPTVLPKLYTKSKNYSDICFSESEINSQNENLNDEHLSFQSKVFDDEPVVDNEIPNVIYLTQNKHVLNEEINIPSFSKLCDPDQPNFSRIFKDKILLCNIIFDFRNPRKQVKGKKEKYAALVEISTLLSNEYEASKLSTYHQDLLLDMLIKNIFDQEPFTSKGKIASTSLKLNFIESSWDQLSIVYKILNQFVLLFPKKVDISLCKKSIYLMNIPDINERESLVTFLKNYTKSHENQFDDIWKLLKSALVNARYDIYTSYCIDPIISFMTILFFESVSTQYQKYFHDILHTHLLPLFDHENLSVYFSKLSSFIHQIIDNEFEGQLSVIIFLIKHFPYQCGNKQHLFVSTIISTIETMDCTHLGSIADKLFSFIAMSVKLPNSKLAEQALLLLLKSNMRPIILSNYELAMDVLYEPLKWSSAFYWNKFVKDQSQTALSALISANLEYQSNKSMSDFLLGSELPTASSEPLFRKKTARRDVKELANVWASISRTAARASRSIDLTKTLQNIKFEFKSEENASAASQQAAVQEKPVTNMYLKGKDSGPLKLNLKIRNFKSNFV